MKRLDFSDLGEVSLVCGLRGARTRVGWVSESSADDGRTLIIEKLCRSLLVSKNLNLKKLIKVSYLNQESRQCFACFSDSYTYEHSMDIMYVLCI